MFNHNCELRDLSESHKHQISEIRGVHAEDMAKKDSANLEYSRKLQEQRKTSNTVSYKFIRIKYISIQLVYHYLVLIYNLISCLLA